jgi:multisubunit Na+/H+ antiporter MnhB subunit
MSSHERIYRRSVKALSAVMLLFGVAILAVTIAAGGGPLSIGVMLGLAFVAVGAGRLWLASRMG